MAKKSDLCPGQQGGFPLFDTMIGKLRNPTLISLNALKYGPLAPIRHAASHRTTVCIVSESPRLGRHYEMSLISKMRSVNSAQPLGMFQVSFCMSFIQNNTLVAFVQDHKYLYCWNDSFIGTLPWQVTHGLKCMSAAQVNDNLCRLLVCEEKNICFLLEVHRIPYDFEEPDAYRGRLNEEFFHLSLDADDPHSGAVGVLGAHLFEGNIGFVATEKGIVRWQFLLSVQKEEGGDWFETYDSISIDESRQLACVMSETDAIFYKQGREEFVVVNFKSFQVTCKVQVPGSKLDSLAIVQVPRELSAYQVLGVEWNERQLTVVDLGSLTRTKLDLPLEGWVEWIIGIPEESTALIVYKHEMVYIRI